MKTALYICGLLKTFEYTYESINEHLIKPNNCDVFVTVWDRLGIDRKHAKVSRINIKDRPVTEEDVNKFENVKDFKIVPFIENCTDEIGDVKIPTEVKRRHPIHYYSTIPLTFMVHSCHLLVDRSYDRYIKIRPDLKFSGPIDVPTLFPDNVLYSSNHRINKATQVSDKFVAGSRQHMNRYAGVHENLNEYWKKKGAVGERLLKDYLTSCNVPIKYFGSPVKIVREDLK